MKGLSVPSGRTSWPASSLIRSLYSVICRPHNLAPGRRLEVYPRKVVLHKPVGGDVEIPIAQVSSLQYRPARALAAGRLRVRYPGDPDRGEELTVQKQQEPAILEAKALIERYQRDLLEGDRGERASSRGHSLADRLRTLGDLKATGLLTEEEFAAKKADLLSEI